MSTEGKLLEKRIPLGKRFLCSFAWMYYPKQRKNRENFAVLQMIKHGAITPCFSLIHFPCFPLWVCSKCHPVIGARYETASTFYTTNVPFSGWAQFIGDEGLAIAIVDQIAHHAVVLNMNGPKSAGSFPDPRPWESVWMPLVEWGHRGFRWYSDGILQTLTRGDSYLENQEEYQTDWKFKAGQNRCNLRNKKNWIGILWYQLFVEGTTGNDIHVSGSIIIIN